MLISLQKRFVGKNMLNLEILQCLTPMFDETQILIPIFNKA